jgi:hypothetical protein
MRILSSISTGLLKVTSRAIKNPVSGIFPPIGLLAIIALTVATVGLPSSGAAKNLWPIYVFATIGIIVACLLWATDRDRYSAIFASTFGWLPVILGALSYGFWYWYADGQITPGTDFFHAAADVLPVLLLAAVLDVHRTKELQSKQLVLPIIAVFLGEISALNVLAFGNAGPGDFAAVASSLVSTTVALVLAVMADLTPTVRRVEKAVQSSEHGLPPTASTENLPPGGDVQAGASPPAKKRRIAAPHPASPDHDRDDR